MICHLRRTFHSPLPGLKPPTRWGTEEGLRNLFGNAITSLQARRCHVVFRARSAQQYVTLTRTYLGPVMKVFEGLTPEAQASLQHDLVENIRRFNRSGDETMRVPAEYLEVVASRR